MRISFKVIADLRNIQIKIELKSNRIYTNQGVIADHINLPTKTARSISPWYVYDHFHARSIIYPVANPVLK